MTKLAKTQRFTRHTFGDSGARSEKNIVSTNFAYTRTGKEVSAAATADVMAAIVAATGALTTIEGITNPDVPRALTVTAAGTAADIASGDVVVTGTNVEGKVITESFTFTANTAATVTGALAFRTITSVLTHAQDGAAATYSVGTSDKIGLNHRIPSGAVYKVLSAGASDFQSDGTVAQSSSLVESNTVIPDTAPDGTTALTIYYTFQNWHVNPTNDNPAYGV